MDRMLWYVLVAAMLVECVPKRSVTVVPPLPTIEKEDPQVALEDSLGITWVYIRGGTFTLGNYVDADSVREVESFYLSSTEVTFAQYDAFIEDYRSNYDEVRKRIEGRLPAYMVYQGGILSWNELVKIDDANWGRGNRPVFNVSYDAAMTFCAWLGDDIHLPSWVEWEYAARNQGKQEVWAGTSNEDSLSYYAWYEKNSNGMTHPVGSKRPNGLGLYDMTGNVREWAVCCAKYYTLFSDGTRIEWRATLGGSWMDSPIEARNSGRPGKVRLTLSRELTTNYVGFRLKKIIQTR